MEREAVEHLRAGRGKRRSLAYRAHERLVTEPEDAARERLAADWWAAGNPSASVVIAFRRVDVAELNARTRAACALGADELGLRASSPSATTC